MKFSFSFEISRKPKAVPAVEAGELGTVFGVTVPEPAKKIEVVQPRSRVKKIPVYRIERRAIV